MDLGEQFETILLDLIEVTAIQPLSRPKDEVFNCMFVNIDLHTACNSLPSSTQGKLDTGAQTMPFRVKDDLVHTQHRIPLSFHDDTKNNC